MLHLTCSPTSMLRTSQFNLLWGVTPISLVAGGILRCLGMEISAKLDWRLCDQMASQDSDIRSMESGRVRMMVLFLYDPSGFMDPSSSGILTPNGPGLGPLPTMKYVSGWFPPKTKCLTMRV